MLILGVASLAAGVVDSVRSQTCDARFEQAKANAQEMLIGREALSAQRQAEAAYSACAAEFLNYSLACFAASLVCLLYWAVFVGGRRRRQMREALGITTTDHRGTCCSCCHSESDYCNSDCCLHFWCTQCAMCQETRTVLEAQREQREADVWAVADGYIPQVVAPVRDHAMARCDTAKDIFAAGEKLLPV